MPRGVARKGQGKGRKTKRAKATLRKVAKAMRKAMPKHPRSLAARARTLGGLQKAAKAEAKPQPLARALAPLVAETADNAGGRRLKLTRDGVGSAIVAHASPGVPTIAIDKIIIGKRHRKDFSHVPALVRSINERGGLIQPISLRPDFTLIAGESRIRAWQHPDCRFRGQPIPYHVLDVDSIIAGEWDENATRKDFTPAEAVAIKRDVEKEFRRLQAERASGEKAAPGRAASGKAAGRVADKAAAFTGKTRRTIEKAEKVVDAAAREPEKHGDLLDEMNRTGKVNAAHKKLKVREAKAAIVAAPPPLPMNAKECATWMIDFPWAGELEAEQDKLDAAGRAFRPYPEMSIKTICAYIKNEIVPRAPENWALWLCVTNFVVVRGYHLHVYGALGFKPEDAATMLTWGKDRIGRGQVLRDQTEHAILLIRGKVTIDVFGKDPPSTLLNAARGENSQKPRQLYELIARVTPAKRYAEIFSTGAHGLPDWDCHGDQVGKYAPAIARAEGELIEEAKAGATDPAYNGLLLTTLETVSAHPGTKLEPDWLKPGGMLDGLVSGTRKRRLTADGRIKVTALRAAFEAALDHAQVSVDAIAQEPGAIVTPERRPQQVDLEDAIAAKSKPGDYGYTIRTCGAQAQHKAPLGHYLSLVIKRGGKQHTCCECGYAFSVVDGHDVPKVEAEILAHWQAVAPAAPDQAAIEEFENADLYRIPQDVISAITARGGHTIAHTIDHEQGEKGHAVATCQCGWQASADRTLPYSGENVLGPQIEAHWRTVLAAAALGTASAAARAAADYPDMPPELVRANAPEAA